MAIINVSKTEEQICQYSNGAMLKKKHSLQQSLLFLVFIECFFLLREEIYILNNLQTPWLKKQARLCLIFVKNEDCIINLNFS